MVEKAEGHEETPPHREGLTAGQELGPKEEVG
jgi:hypothetical protein